MIHFVVHIFTRAGVEAEFTFADFTEETREQNGITVRLGNAFPHEVTTTPPAGDRVRSIHYSVSTELCNFHQVIVPDTGRTYPAQMQLVDFWARVDKSLASNVRMPLYILTGQDHNASLAFGVLGENFETDFVATEPGRNRALVAWMKRFSLQIQRGTHDFPIPDHVALAHADGHITEKIWFQEREVLIGKSWIQALGEFGHALADHAGAQPRTTPASLEPYWCSWTDWFSGDVDAQVIRDNVREGLALGITNFIIDDGWFGPGLDHDFDTTLNIGDWQEDGSRITDLRGLVQEIHDGGGRAIIWCAPHAVSPDARCFPERKPYLLMETPDQLHLTSNGYHPLCFQCPEARAIMADIAAGLVERYDVDGAKYDLFNNLPDGPCRCATHEHDTSSVIEGLRRTLALIDERTRAVKPDYIVELKQNYATPYLYEYGTCVRAGDTPYNPEGNYLRTAFIQAYTPFAINDYQTITNHDTLDAAAAMIIKMMAVGIPTYSIDLTRLRSEHKELLAFYHKWYAEHVTLDTAERRLLDPDLGVWRLLGREDVYFVVNRESRVRLERVRDCQILWGSFAGQLHLELPDEGSFKVVMRDPAGGQSETLQYTDCRQATIPTKVGSILCLVFL